MKKRVLIFTASTGHGHNQVATSMKQELEKNGCEVTIMEPFKEVSKSLDVLVSDGYRVLATKMPKMYGTIYKMSNGQIIGKSVEKISVKALEEKLYELIQEGEPDLVISTHPLMVKAMCSLKGKFLYQGPFVSIVTDYLPHKCYISPMVDAYIVGSEYTKAKLIEKGILPDSIYVHGIPINPAFKEVTATDPRDSRFTILLMGGSMGVNGIKKVFKELLQVEAPLKMIVVCGNNESLKKTLEEKYRIEDPNKEVHILGFTNKISEYMDISDVIITKPGGLTVTEAFAKNIPMIIPYFIPGQEAENTEMLVEVGAAIYTEHIKELKDIMENLIADGSILLKIKQNMLKVSKNLSIDNSVKLCMHLMEQPAASVEIRYAE